METLLPPLMGAVVVHVHAGALARDSAIITSSEMNPTFLQHVRTVCGGDDLAALACCRRIDVLPHSVHVRVQPCSGVACSRRNYDHYVY